MSIFDSNPISEVQKGVNNLSKLALRYKTNKTPQFGRSYVPFYYDLFADRNNKIKKILQIGLGDLEKNSLYFWRDYFPKAMIYGMGDSKKYVFKRGRIQTFLCERSDAAGLKNLIVKIGKDIDVVIDEGTRSPKEIVLSFQAVMPMLKKSATYIIESTDRLQAGEIIKNLGNYDYNMMRHHRMISRYDRLIVVTNRTG